MNSTQDPGLLRYVIGSLVVGACWGLTTPFMRRAALDTRPQSKRQVPDAKASWIWKRAVSLWHAVLDLVQRPSYTVPLVINLSGSALFFLIVGQAGTSPLMWPDICSCRRPQLDGSDYKFFSVSVHRAWRVDCRGEVDIERYSVCSTVHG
jgi:Putative transmembrane family 234